MNRCCEIHDRCYSDAGEMDKGFWDKVVSAFGHIVPTYNFKCENGIAACGKKLWGTICKSTNVCMFAIRCIFFLMTLSYVC